MNGEARANPGLDDCTAIVPFPVDVDKVARWIEMVEAAIDNPPECVDVLLDLADSLETAWRAILCAEARR